MQNLSGKPTVMYYPPLSNIKKAFAEAKAYSFFGLKDLEASKTRLANFFRTQ